MKTFCTLIFCLLFFTIAHGQNDKVYFLDVTIDDALKLAQEENKCVFIFLVESNSSSCSFFETAVFNKGEVGDKFNQSFINIKVAADSEYGQALINKYKVKQLPAFIGIKPGEKPNFTYNIQNTEQLLKFADNFSS